MPDYTQAGGSTYSGYSATTQPTAPQYQNSTKTAPKPTDVAYNDYRAYLGVGLSDQEAVARAWANHPSPPPPPPPPPAPTAGGLMPKTYSLQSTGGSPTPAYPGASYGAGANGYDAPIYATTPAYPGATYGVGPDGKDHPVAPAGSNVGNLAFGANGSAPTTNTIGLGNVNGTSPTTMNPGTSPSVSVPAGNGTLQKITGQSTSEGTAGMMSSGQVDGGIRTTTTGGVATTSQPGGTYGSPLSLPTTTGGTNNTGVGTGAGAPTTAASAPAPGGGLLPSTQASTGAFVAPGAPNLGNAPSLNNPFAGLLNPFLTPINGATYQARLAGQGVANAEQQYGLLNQRMRDDLAARGLSQGGTSGIEAGDARDLMLQTAQARTTALNDAATTAADKGAQWELAKAQGNLAYGTQAFDQFQKGALLPGEVQGQTITNETNSANLQLIKQNWDKLQQKIAAGVDLSVAEAKFQQQLAAHPEVAMALGILPDLLKSGGQVAGALLPAAIAAI